MPIPFESSSGNAKASPRFSPLKSPRYPLSHPRQASRNTVDSRRTSKLFASQAVDGQGALSSQLSDTQYLGQYGLDSSPRKSSAFTTPPRKLSPSNLPSLACSPRSTTSPAASQDGAQDEEEFLAGDYQSGTNSWTYLPEEDEADLSLADTWSYEEYCAAGRKLDVDGYPLSPSNPPSPVAQAGALKAEPVSPTPEAKNLGCVSFDLTPFEQWIIQRVREAGKDGISAADGLYRLRERCREQERRELNLMARELDLLRRLKEINHLSRDLE
ncbi:hypothetical protein C8R47DRAFT_1215317 [Mycena vitilis]|nr:hypothetical protein C8R47DRAFT_1215317 [Mycena vitilis]